jgi:NAD(P)-dependent dehydrogenase (short-subunit alcohol dehydrogenase family)
MGIWPVGCFEGKKTFVIGGTSGIGEAIARAFTSEGADVTASGASDAEASAARERLPGAQVVTLDVRDAEAVRIAFSSLERLDHVVYAAGVIRRGEEHDPAVFDTVLDVNLNGAMRVASAVRPLLANRQGTILYVASMLSFFGGALVPATRRQRAALPS